jgi:hypothetical protein
LRKQKPQIFCQNKEDELGRAFSIHWSNEKYPHNVSLISEWRKLLERDTLWNLSTEMDVTEVRCDVDGIDLSWNRNQCCGYVNAAVVLQVAYKAPNFVSR